MANHIGENTLEPCDVCGCLEGCRLDRWFNIVTCKKHSVTAPSKVQEAKAERLRRGK